MTPQFSGGALTVGALPFGPSAATACYTTLALGYCSLISTSECRWMISTNQSKQVGPSERRARDNCTLTADRLEGWHRKSLRSNWRIVSA